MIKPLISEKSFKLAGEENCYVFLGTPKDRIADVKKFVETFFNVTVEKVNVARINKANRFNRKSRTWSKGKIFKKFFVFLKSGDEIDVFKK